jgi:prepilin-type N-terminal cleavage/methylation domain-containing protein
MKTNKKKGFTLIELIVVIAILGILATLIVPRLMGFQETARESSDETLAQSVANACIIHITQENSFTWTNANDLLNAVAGDGLIDSTYVSIDAINGALKSTKYKNDGTDGGFAISFNTTNYQLTVTLDDATSTTATDKFEIIK